LDCPAAAPPHVRATGLAARRFAARRGAETADWPLPIPGRHLVTAALAAIGAATELGVPLDEAAVALATMDAPAHRMSVRRTEDLVVIDDSYNASPAAVAAALAVLGSAGGRRVAVLGDMLELGTLSADAHEEAGRQAATKADVLVGIGDLARTIVSAARTSGMRETYPVADAAEALMLLRRILRR